MKHFRRLETQAALMGMRLRHLPRDRRAVGTLEMVILTACLIGLALIFNQQIRGFADRVFANVFDADNVLGQIQP